MRIIFQISFDVIQLSINQEALADDRYFSCTSPKKIATSNSYD